MYGSLALKLKQSGFGAQWKSPQDVKSVKGSVEMVALAFSGLPRTIKRTPGRDAPEKTSNSHGRCRKKSGGLTLQQEISREVESLEYYIRQLDRGGIITKS
jgi:hypothetical protein